MTAATARFLARLVIGQAGRVAYGNDAGVINSVRVWRAIHVPDDALWAPGRLRRRRALSVMSNLMHCDTHPVSLTKFFVQLSPGVDATTGALQLLPIASTRRAMRRGFVRPDIVLGPARRILADTDGVVVFDGPPGSGLLLNSELCLHAANIPRPGSSRLMLQFVLGPSVTPLDDNWATKLRPDVKVRSVRNTKRDSVCPDEPSIVLSQVGAPTRS